MAPYLALYHDNLALEIASRMAPTHVQKEPHARRSLLSNRKPWDALNLNTSPLIKIKLSYKNTLSHKEDSMIRLPPEVDSPSITLWKSDAATKDHHVEDSDTLYWNVAWCCSNRLTRWTNGKGCTIPGWKLPYQGKELPLSTGKRPWRWWWRRPKVKST